MLGAGLHGGGRAPEAGAAAQAQHHHLRQHFYLDDLPQSTEPLDENPRPHSSLAAQIEEDFVTGDEGYSGRPFPQLCGPDFMGAGPDTDDDSGADSAFCRRRRHRASRGGLRLRKGRGADRAAPIIIGRPSQAEELIVGPASAPKKWSGPPRQTSRGWLRSKRRRSHAAFGGRRRGGGGLRS